MCLLYRPYIGMSYIIGKLLNSALHWCYFMQRAISHIQYSPNLLYFSGAKLKRFAVFYSCWILVLCFVRENKIYLKNCLLVDVRENEMLINWCQRKLANFDWNVTDLRGNTKCFCLLEEEIKKKLESHFFLLDMISVRQRTYWLYNIVECQRGGVSASPAPTGVGRCRAHTVSVGGMSLYY